MMINRIKATRAELYKKLNDMNEKNNNVDTNDDDDNYIVNSNDILKQPPGNSIINSNIITDNEAESIKGTIIK